MALDSGTNWNSIVLAFLNIRLFFSYLRNIGWLSPQGNTHSNLPDRGEGMSGHLPGEWAGEPDPQVFGLKVPYHQNYTSVFKQGISVRKFIH